MHDELARVPPWDWTASFVVRWGAQTARPPDLSAVYSVSICPNGKQARDNVCKMPHSRDVSTTCTTAARVEIENARSPSGFA